MLQMTLFLKEFEPQPIVKLSNFFNIEAMLDTGAALPVWVKDEKILQAIGGVKEHDHAILKGFGGEARGTLYRIPIFKVGDLIFPHLPIIAARLDVTCHMILSATMFSRLIYEIDDFHHKLNITIPESESAIRNIKAYDENGRLKIVLAND